MQKYALVTGSTKGIGKQIAIDLLQAGHFVVLNYAHSDSDAENALAEIAEVSDSFHIIKADLSTNEGIEQLILGVKKITSVLDYLILNAGVTIRSSFEEVTYSDWNAIFNANLAMPFFLVQCTYELMRDNGRILFVGSVLGRFAHAVSIPYGVSKGALEVLVKYLVPCVAPKNITVNVVAPGFTNTDWQKDKHPAQRKRIEDKISLHRFADVSEVSATCMHLIDNGYINGQTICVDGGYAIS